MPAFVDTFAILRAEASARLVELDLVEVSGAVVSNAAELAETHDLRAYDAVPLASAVSLGDAELLVLTWDSVQARAALAERLAVAPGSWRRYSSSSLSAAELMQ